MSVPPSSFAIGPVYTLVEENSAIVSSVTLTKIVAPSVQPVEYVVSRPFLRCRYQSASTMPSHGETQYTSTSR